MYVNLLGGGGGGGLGRGAADIVTKLQPLLGWKPCLPCSLGFPHMCTLVCVDAQNTPKGERGY